MSEKEYKEKCNNMFAQNSILLHRIDKLENQNKTILKDNDNLNEWIDELKAQIEKMKCCQNCLSFFNGGCRKEIRGCFCCNKWELNKRELAE